MRKRKDVERHRTKTDAATAAIRGLLPDIALPAPRSDEALLKEAVRIFQSIPNPPSPADIVDLRTVMNLLAEMRDSPLPKPTVGTLVKQDEGRTTFVNRSRTGKDLGRPSKKLPRQVGNEKAEEAFIVRLLDVERDIRRSLALKSPDKVRAGKKSGVARQSGARRIAVAADEVSPDAPTSVATRLIAKKTGLSRRHVRRHVKKSDRNTTPK